MFSLLAVDPAKNKSGWALFIEGHLHSSGTIISPDKPEVNHYDRLVIEVPQVYRVASKGDPNDLIDCALVAGIWLGRITARRYKVYRPREWKRQIPKKIHHERILATLRPSDNLSLLPGPKTTIKTYNDSKSPRLDQLDAIGLGLTDLGRMTI